MSIRSTSGRKESALQSGKHHQRVNDAQTLMLDDMELTWEKRHPMFSDWRKELKGYSVSVWLKPGRTKELILDVPFAVYGLDHLPNTDRWNQVLSMAIRSAMDAGWDPESRGGARRHTPE
ncbi:MAG: hypothetical protein ABIR28_00875 [Vicinamibacteria bacterium]